MPDHLGVVSADHVRRAVSLGVAQIGHGKRPPLTRMRPGDRLVYYSPRQELGGPATLRAFTAIGTVTDDEIWQADEGAFQPWRRRVEYLSGTQVPLGDVTDQLDLTRDPHWGYLLRRGLVPLTTADADLLIARFTATA